MVASAGPSSSGQQPSVDDASHGAHELEEFEQKVRRSLVIEEISPLVTVAMIQRALEQFGTVLSVEILSNPVDPKFTAKRALVEMKTIREAAFAVKEIQEHPFMIKGVPRPVRALRAAPNLFANRPRKSRNSRIAWKWVESDNPDRALFFELKKLAKKHAAETAYLAEELRKEEEKLAQEQEEKVKDNIKKLDEIIVCIKDNVIQRLSRYYGLRYVHD